VTFIAGFFLYAEIIGNNFNYFSIPVYASNALQA
jgi:hypothetical protein